MRPCFFGPFKIRVFPMFKIKLFQNFFNFNGRISGNLTTFAGTIQGRLQNLLKLRDRAYG